MLRNERHLDANCARIRKVSKTTISKTFRQRLCLCGVWTILISSVFCWFLVDLWSDNGMIPTQIVSYFVTFKIGMLVANDENGHGKVSYIDNVFCVSCNRNSVLWWSDKKKWNQPKTSGPQTWLTTPTIIRSQFLLCVVSFLYSEAVYERVS